MIPERLTQALPKLLQDIDLKEQWSLTKLPGDASNRSYYRVIAPSQIFMVMVLAQTGANSLAEEITKTNRKITELPFIDVLNYLAKKGTRVPKLFGYDEARGVLLLEDFGDNLLLDVAQKSSPKEIQAHYEKALDELVKLSLVEDADPRDSIAFARSFDRDLYNWEFMHFVECALDQRLPNPPKNGARQKIVGSLLALTDEYLTWEKVFCHRDYHSRNLIVLKNGMGIIDFQDALLAPLFYDLGSLLRDSYVALDEKMQDDLVERYRRQMQPRKLKNTSSREEFRRAFDIMSTHRNLKAAGRFCYIDKVKGNPRYLADVPRTLGYVRKTIERYEDLKSLRTTLLPYLDEIIATCP